MKAKVFPISIWLLLLLMLIVNVIPIENSNSASMSSKRLFIFRLDYILHSLIWLAFAWLWIFSRIIGFRFFGRYEIVTYLLLLFVSATVCEYLQMLVPWRAFNPVDLSYNLIGAALATVFIFISGSGSKAQSGHQK